MNCIMLAPNQHIKWSILEKLMQSSVGRIAISEEWPSLDVKLESLCRQACGGKIIGVAANEALTVGGNKNLMWIDIDSPNYELVSEWLKKQNVIPQGSYIQLRSTTWNSHIYVCTNEPLLEDYHVGMKRLIESSMPKQLKGHLDRVYGPMSPRIIFLPMLSLTNAEIPQRLVKHLTEVMKLPLDKIEGPFARATRNIKNESMNKAE